MTVTDSSDEAADYEFASTSPRGLNRGQGSEHFGMSNLSFDAEALADHHPDEAVEAMDWTVDALNAVSRHPHLLLWVRGPKRELFFGWNPVQEQGLQCGFFRAVSFTTERRTPYEYTTDAEIDGGLVNFNDAINTISDVLPEAVRSSSSKRVPTLLVDMEVVNDHPTVKAKHPVFNLDEGPGTHEHLVRWSRKNVQLDAVPHQYAKSLCNPIEDSMAIERSQEQAQEAFDSQVAVYRTD